MSASMCRPALSHSQLVIRRADAEAALGDLAALVRGLAASETTESGRRIGL
jgi:hypothetical protein